jgi:hypothetical protein
MATRGPLGHSRLISSGLVGLFLVPILSGAPAPSHSLRDASVQAKLVKEVRAVLPPGWSVTRTADKITPPDWHTDDPKAGFLVAGGDGTESFEIYFLPRDWVGIRKLPNRVREGGWGEGVVACDHYQTVTFSSDDKFFRDRVYDLVTRKLHDPYQVDHSDRRADRLARRKEAAADRAAQALVRKHCRTAEEFTEAARSLVALDVPARTVFIRAVREVPDPFKDTYCLALGRLGGEEAVGTLCEVVADPRGPDALRGWAAVALGPHDDRRIGPAVKKGMALTRNDEALARMAWVLMRFRYQPAAPELLAALKRMTSDYYRAEVAQALAALHCQDAVPELRAWLARLREGKRPDALLTERVELALLRLTADWGKPGGGARFLLVPPTPAVLGREMILTVHAENVGEKELEAWHTLGDGLTLDGKPVPADLDIGGITSSFGPGTTHTLRYDLARDLKTAGEHTVQYTRGEARSRPVRFTVRRAPR